MIMHMSGSVAIAGVHANMYTLDLDLGRGPCDVDCCNRARQNSNGTYS